MNLNQDKKPEYEVDIVESTKDKIVLIKNEYDIAWEE